MDSKFLVTPIVLGIIGIVSLIGIIAGIQSIYADTAPESWNFDKPTSTISVTGTSIAKVSPDTVSISFTVESQRTTAQAAVQSNAMISDSVIKALKENGVLEPEISTSYYSVYPIYEYVSEPLECTQYGQGDQAQKYCPPDSQKQILVGYKAANGIQIESVQLDKIGQWIDTAVGAGSSRVEYLYFSVSDEKQNEIRNNLTSAAVEDARNKAEIAVKPLGMKIVDVQSVNLDSYPIIYQKRGYETAAGAPSTTTPIIPGIQSVSTTVHIIFEIGSYSQGRNPINATIDAEVNREFNITLDSNPSTGYQWQVKKIDASLLEQTNDEYVSSKSGLVGTAGKQVLTFEALKEGRTTIMLEYARPWESANPARTYFVDVIIMHTNQNHDN